MHPLQAHVLHHVSYPRAHLLAVSWRRCESPGLFADELSTKAHVVRKKAGPQLDLRIFCQSLLIARCWWLLLHQGGRQQGSPGGHGLKQPGSERYCGCPPRSKSNTGNSMTTRADSDTGWSPLADPQNCIDCLGRSDATRPPRRAWVESSPRRRRLPARWLIWPLLSFWDI